MKRLYVLYDQDCALCVNCSRWLMRQPAFLELHFIPLQSPEIAQQFPGLRKSVQFDLNEKITVVSDEGAVYQGHHAWIMCLYALREYRESAQRLSHPALLPFARLACEMVSKNRLAISHFLNEPVAELRNKLAATVPGYCRPRGGCDG